MLYSDGLGKYVEIDIDVFLSMNDEDFRDLRASGYGYEIPDNPFHDSFSKSSRVILDDDDIDEIILEELSHIDELDIDLDFEDLEEI